MEIKVIHVHLDLRKIFIILVWKDQQSLYQHHFHIIILPVLFCEISINYFIIELQYNHVLISVVPILDFAYNSDTDIIGN